MTGKAKYVLFKSQDGKYYFEQIAGNGKVLDTSETYERIQSAIDGAIAAGASRDDLPLEYRGEKEGS